MKYYKLTEKIRTCYYYSSSPITLTRIEAIENFKTIDGKEIKKGDLGGWIEKEGNLGQDKSWIDESSTVCGHSIVEYSSLSNNVLIYDSTIIDSVISDSTTIKASNICRSKVFWNSLVVESLVVKSMISDGSDILGIILKYSTVENGVEIYNLVSNRGLGSWLKISKSILCNSVSILVSDPLDCKATGEFLIINSELRDFCKVDINLSKIKSIPFSKFSNSKLSQGANLKGRFNISKSNISGEKILIGNNLNNVNIYKSEIVGNDIKLSGAVKVINSNIKGNSIEVTSTKYSQIVNSTVLSNTTLLGENKILDTEISNLKIIDGKVT